MRKWDFPFSDFLFIPEENGKIRKFNPNFPIFSFSHWKMRKWEYPADIWDMRLGSEVMFEIWALYLRFQIKSELRWMIWEIWITYEAESWNLRPNLPFSHFLIGKDRMATLEPFVISKQIELEGWGWSWIEDNLM